jgi:hypothetical protein
MLFSYVGVVQGLNLSAVGYLFKYIRYAKIYIKIKDTRNAKTLQAIFSYGQHLYNALPIMPLICCVGEAYKARKMPKPYGQVGNKTMMASPVRE